MSVEFTRQCQSEGQKRQKESERKKRKEGKEERGRERRKKEKEGKRGKRICKETAILKSRPLTRERAPASERFWLARLKPQKLGTWPVG